MKSASSLNLFLWCSRGRLDVACEEGSSVCAVVVRVKVKGRKEEEEEVEGEVSTAASPR